MSLGIVIKGAEGMVLAADSRVTLFAQSPGAGGSGAVLSPAYYDNATKLLRVKGQDHVGAVTYGIGAMMTANGPRTMHSFISEFETELASNGSGRLSVQTFADRLAEFYGRMFAGLHTAPPSNDNIEFIVGGYDVGAPYGRVFQFRIPNASTPVEVNPSQFGMTWGGQHELVSRVMKGFDPTLPGLLQKELSLDAATLGQLVQKLTTSLPLAIPLQFLPLQDCVDLATFFIQGTVNFQRFAVGVRGVGGSVDVATISPSGFEWIAQKKITSRSSL